MNQKLLRSQMSLGVVTFVIIHEIIFNQSEEAESFSKAGTLPGGPSSWQSVKLDDYLWRSNKNL